MNFKTSAVGILLLVGNANAWWQPTPSATWQIVLSQPLKNTAIAVDAYDFDLFDNPASTITAIHNNNRKAICYFSAGSWERWRKDAGDFNKTDLGKPLDGWPGERWLNVMSTDVRNIMQQRMDLAVQKGCDAIDPDNIDAFDNGGGGFGLTKANAIDYVNFLASEGHKRGLSVGLKNGGAIISSVLSEVDFSVNEQCLQYHECQTFRPFIDANKPVFHIEYVKGTPPKSKVNSICSAQSSRDFSTVIKHLNLDDYLITCPSAGTPSAQHHGNGDSPASPTLRGRKTPGPSTNACGNSAALLAKASSVYLLTGLLTGLFCTY